jgi:LuxR family maltose regulon positive regulatory protein
MGSVIEILALEALALEAQGNHLQAVATLEQALTLAEPEGYVRMFVEEGKPMQLLMADLRMRIADAGLRSYAERLLAAFSSAASADGAAPDRSEIRIPKSNMIEPLSERELEVLRLIADGLSNREIAERLVVGTGTVKTHINNIYRKLDVKSRTQAIHRARELGVLTA